MNDFAHIMLKPKEELEVLQGFPWVFDNEIDTIKWAQDATTGVKTTTQEDSSLPSGSVVELYSRKGAFLGTGVFNRASKIRVRLISAEHADRVMENPSAFWRKKVYDAVNLRHLLFNEEESYRLIFAESDGLPGLIVEKYVSRSGTYLVVQFLALATEVFRSEILDALKKAVHAHYIYERSDAAVREKEGLKERFGWIGKRGQEEIVITENGISFAVDIARGQKTGFFLDQKQNREVLQGFCKGKRVLDAFSHTGAFGLNAVKGGAREVISVDSSEEAVSLIKKNIELNGAKGIMTAVLSDAFSVLKEYEAKGEKFDVIILDPPAFTKSAKLIKKAYSGYKEINLRALRLLNEGGILVTCSCSYYFDSNTFYSMLLHAAKDSHRTVRVLHKLGAAPDHPVLLGYPKSEYLKCAVCHVR